MEHTVEQNPEQQSGATAEVSKPSAHPYMDMLQANLTSHRTLVTLLESKIKILDKSIEHAKGNMNPTMQEELNLVEWQIAKMKTQSEINALQKVIFEKDRYYNEYIIQYEKDIKEVEKNLKNTIVIARKSSKENVQKVLAMVKWEKIDNDDEAKISLYKHLKKYLAQ